MTARLVVIGLGRIGRLHAANLAGRVHGAELVGVVDPVAPLARAEGERHGVPWAIALNSLSVAADGIVVAAPTGSHVALVEQAAAAGLHVLCEKPLGFDPEAALRAVEAARSAGVVLRVGFQRRFDRDWRALAASDLGELQLLRSSHRNARGPAASGPLGDVFVDVAVHDLDCARWLGGEVAELFACERAGTATISLRFESGALGLIDVTRRAGYGFDCTAELVGTRATARLGTTWRATDVELLSGGRASARLAGDHAERHAAAYVAELEGFASLVAAASTDAGFVAAGASGEDAVAALRLAQAARRSAATGAPQAVGATVQVPA